MSFNYPPLPPGDGLRLLILEPANTEPQNPLRASLISVPFSSKPKYIGLSYTWLAGQESQKNLSCTIPQWVKNFRLNGEPFKIGYNLALALLNLQHNSQPLTLWVDQICINQDDVQERNSQVALMSFIYSRATTVVSWLGMPNNHRIDPNKGPPDGGTDDTTLYIPKEAKLGITVDNFRFADGINIDSSLTGASLYWQRLWIVQEVCLARSVVFLFGRSFWSEKQVSAHLRKQTHQTTYDAASGISPMARLMKARENRFTAAMRLETLIEQFMGCGCGEIRDRVYGLVGLANDVDAILEGASQHTWEGFIKDRYRGRGQIPIDYSRSFYDIWCDVVAFVYFRAKAQLDFGKERHQMEDERRARLVRFAGVLQAALGGRIDASISRTPSDAPQPLLKVKGYIAGSVSRIGPSYSDFVGVYSSRQQWMGTWDRLYTADEDLAKLRMLEQAYEAKILDFGEEELARIAPIDSPVTVGYSPFRQKELPADSSSTKTAAASSSGEPKRFIGENLCLGMAPSNANTGDLIVRFWNCDAAIVMRPSIEGDSLFRGWQDTTNRTYYRLIGRADIADGIRDNPYDHKAKDAMNIFNAKWQNRDGGHYVAEQNKEPRTKALYVLMDFATLQKISEAIAF
jgi:hypothetical protein